jgi:hypothetical protein
MLVAAQLDLHGAASGLKIDDLMKLSRGRHLVRIRIIVNHHRSKSGFFVFNHARVRPLT